MKQITVAQQRKIDRITQRGKEAQFAEGRIFTFGAFLDPLATLADAKYAVSICRHTESSKMMYKKEGRYCIKEYKAGVFIAEHFTN